MRTTLQIDNDVLDAARQLATSQQRSVGAVISEPARRALQPTGIKLDGIFDVFNVPPGAAPIPQPT